MENIRANLGDDIFLVHVDMWKWKDQHVTSKGQRKILGLWQGGGGGHWAQYHTRSLGKFSTGYYFLVQYLSFTIESQYFVTNTWRSPTLNLVKMSKKVQPCSSTAIV